MRSTLIALLAAGSLLFAACSSDDSDDASSDTSPETTAAQTEDSPDGDDAGEDTSADSDATVTVAETDLGEALVGPDGFVLYGFTEDSAGEPTCEDTCADAWPPLTVDSAELPSDLDPGVFSVVERPDGTFQLKAGDWPLYYFAGDAAPGDTSGQGSGGVWFVAAPDGTLIDAP